jgi:DUF1680 family protein
MLRFAPPHWSRVSFTDPFWAPRLALMRERTLPALYTQLRTSGRINALRLTWQPGDHPVPHQFWDSDIAKWLEASCYSLATQPDPVLEAHVEEVVGLLQQAQQPDGYLNSYVTCVDPAGRWTDLRDGHELYCAGHLIEAAVAHYRSTGRRALLDVMCRYADYIASVFGTADGQKRGYCGHPEVELALVRLARATGEQRYLRLSKYFVDERGQEPYYFDIEGLARAKKPRASDGYYRRHGLRGPELRRYNQSHAPVRDQTEVVGHAVRAMYLYSAMADLAAETDDPTLLQACERLWTHLTCTRMYVTGGIGSSAHNEGFLSDYELPNATAYAESCAAIGLVMWSQRMFHLTGDGQYTDVMERVLYNAVAAAIGADGSHFFYANPLASDGSAHRQPWFDVACCPPNAARLLGSLGAYAFSEGDESVAVHFFARASAELNVGSQSARLDVASNYPWDGRVAITVEVPHPAMFEVAVRIPGWSRNADLRINDQPYSLKDVCTQGYARLNRTWCAGDRIELDLPMPVERVSAHPRVADDAGCVALQRGPIVYCLEQVDNDDEPLHALLLRHGARVTARHEPDLLGGVTTLHADGLKSETNGWDGRLYRTRQQSRLLPHHLVGVPYAVWDNRAAGAMRVWIREWV